jgi:apolipoprotein N-acyltransferase
MSQFSLGEANQPTLQVGELAIAPFVCYEIVYSELMRTMVRDSDVLLTISNDGWFGDSIGPWQHLQIAQFRAKEMGRYMIRATNTGITAVINENGEITAQVPQFVRTTLTSKVTPLMGTTPYVRWGQWPLLFLVVLFILAGLPIRNKQTS